MTIDDMTIAPHRGPRAGLVHRVLLAEEQASLHGLRGTHGDAATEGEAMTYYALRYKPGSALALRWPNPTTFSTTDREHLDEIRRQCPNADVLEIVEVD